MRIFSGKKTFSWFKTPGIDGKTTSNLSFCYGAAFVGAQGKEEEEEMEMEKKQAEL